MTRRAPPKEARRFAIPLANLHTKVYIKASSQKKEATVAQTGLSEDHVSVPLEAKDNAGQTAHLIALRWGGVFLALTPKGKAPKDACVAAIPIGRLSNDLEVTYVTYQALRHKSGGTIVHADGAMRIKSGKEGLTLIYTPFRAQRTLQITVEAFAKALTDLKAAAQGKWGPQWN